MAPEHDEAKQSIMSSDYRSTPHMESEGIRAVRQFPSLSDRGWSAGLPTIHLTVLAVQAMLSAARGRSQGAFPHCLDYAAVATYLLRREVFSWSAWGCALYRLGRAAPDHSTRGGLPCGSTIVLFWRHRTAAAPSRYVPPLRPDLWLTQWPVLWIPMKNWWSWSFGTWVARTVVGIVVYLIGRDLNNLQQGRRWRISSGMYTGATGPGQG